MQKTKKSNPRGFTLFETMISISFFVLIIMVSTTLFLMSQDIYRTGSKQSELTQNARICLDRISREIRQSNNIVTDFSTIATSSMIFFQDGHDLSQISYIKYFASSTDLIRKHFAYEFSSAPGVYVHYNSLDALSQPPDEVVLEERFIGEYFNDIEFEMNQGLMDIRFNLRDNNISLDLATKAYVRNW